MQELKKDIIESIGAIKEAWINAVHEAEKNNEGLDLTQVMKAENKIQNELMIKIFQAEERIKKKKNKLF